MFLCFNGCPYFAHVGVYRIRPNAHTNPRGCFQGVCDTPLPGLFADIQFVFILNSRKDEMFIETSVD